LGHVQSGGADAQKRGDLDQLVDAAVVVEQKLVPERTGGLLLLKSRREKYAQYYIDGARSREVEVAKPRREHEKQLPGPVRRLHRANASRKRASVQVHRLGPGSHLGREALVVRVHSEVGDVMLRLQSRRCPQNHRLSHQMHHRNTSLREPLHKRCCLLTASGHRFDEVVGDLIVHQLEARSAAGPVDPASRRLGHFHQRAFQMCCVAFKSDTTQGRIFGPHCRVLDHHL